MRHLATGLPVLEAEVCDRIDFAKAMTYGNTVQEVDPRHPGAREIAALAAELQACLPSGDPDT